MKYTKDIIISNTEPTTNALWLKPTSDGNYKLYIYNANGCTALISGDASTGISFEYIQDINDIVIDKN